MVATVNGPEIDRGLVLYIRSHSQEGADRGYRLTTSHCS